MPRQVLRIDGFYYIEKQILPALERVLNIAGLDPRRWHDPNPVLIPHHP